MIPRREKLYGDKHTNTKILASVALWCCRGILSRPASMRKDIADSCAQPGNKLKDALKRSGLFCSRCRTFGESKLYISYMTNTIPTVTDIRKSKHEFLSNLAPLLVLYKNGSSSTRYSVRKLRVTLPNSRNIERIRLPARTAIQNYLTALNNVGRWPYPPQCDAISKVNWYQTVLCLVNIDSGTGTTKVMIRFLRHGRSFADRASARIKTSEPINCRKKALQIVKLFKILEVRRQQVFSNQRRLTCSVCVHVEQSTIFRTFFLQVCI